MYRLSNSYLLCLLFLVGVHDVHSQSGSYIEFKGNRLDSTSVVILTDIGEQPSSTQVPDTVTGDALVCVTDYRPCCRGADGATGGTGEWLFPSGEEVPGTGGTTPHMGIYRNRGTGIVRLNRQADSTLMTVGDYCCMIPVSTTNMARICVTVGEARPTTITDTPSTTATTLSLPTQQTETEPSTPETTAFTTEPPTNPQPVCSECLATNNTLLGFVIFLSFAVVALILALVTALWYISCVLRRIPSRGRSGNSLKVVHYRQTESRGLSQRERIHDELRVSVRRNLSYGDVNRPEQEDTPEYEDIEVRRPVQQQDTLEYDDVRILNPKRQGAETLNFHNRGFGQDSSEDLTEHTDGQVSSGTELDATYENVTITPSGETTGDEALSHDSTEEHEQTERDDSQNDQAISTTYENVTPLQEAADDTGGSEVKVENDLKHT